MDADWRMAEAARQVFLLLWLAGIIVNLLTVDAPRYYDIALRDFGLLLGALALTRLAWAAYSEQRSRTTVGAVASPSERAVRV